MRWPRRLRETEPERALERERDSKCWAVLSSLKEVLPGIRAVIVLGPHAELLDFAAIDRGIDASLLAREFATLLRIVERTSLDTGLGDLHQQILISSSALVLVQHLPRNRVAVFVCSPDEHLGRLRYELKRSLLYSTLSNL